MKSDRRCDPGRRRLLHKLQHLRPADLKPGVVLPQHPWRGFDERVSLRVIQAAREVAPLIRVLARAEYINQHEAFAQAGAAIIRYDEAESATDLAEALLQDIDVPSDRIDAVIANIRNELAPLRGRLKADL